VFTRLTGFLFGKPPITRTEVAQMIEEAVIRVQNSLPAAPPDPQPQLQQLSSQYQTMSATVNGLKLAQSDLSNEVQHQAQLTNLGELNRLPAQVQILATTVDQLVRSTPPDPTQKLQMKLTQLETQLQKYRQEISLELAQLRTEIPEQKQIGALVDRFVTLQAELNHWQRTFSEALAQPSPPTVPTLPPGRYEDYLGAGRILLLSGETQQALHNLELALGINTQGAEAWYIKAMAQAQMDQPDQALMSLAQALQLHPDKQAQASTGLDFPSLVGDERFKQLVGHGTAPEAEIYLPRLDLASLFD